MSTYPPEPNSITGRNSTLLQPDRLSMPRGPGNEGERIFAKLLPAGRTLLESLRAEQQRERERQS